MFVGAYLMWIVVRGAEGLATWFDSIELILVLIAGGVIGGLGFAGLVMLKIVREVRTTRILLMHRLKEK